MNNWLVPFIESPVMVVIITAIVTAICSFFVWKFQNKIKEYNEIEKKLHGTRFEIYKNVLNPYILLFSAVAKEDENAKKKAMEKIISYEYRQEVFNLILLGSDSVVLAFNALMRHAYTAEQTGQNANKMIRLWAKFILELRKNLGEKNTKLDEVNMIENQIKDLDRQKIMTS